MKAFLTGEHCFLQLTGKSNIKKPAVLLAQFKTARKGLSLTQKGQRSAAEQSHWSW